MLCRIRIFRFGVDIREVIMIMVRFIMMVWLIFVMMFGSVSGIWILNSFCWGVMLNVLVVLMIFLFISWMLRLVSWIIGMMVYRMMVMLYSLDLVMLNRKISGIRYMNGGRVCSMFSIGMVSCCIMLFWDMVMLMGILSSIYRKVYMKMMVRVCMVYL